ncbi:uncharacterized protein [Aristolochia californica]|uniref:uncharacterized protein n=1 Tax=Aristolochia californica TaxID=171875 RepID=UPI0035D8CED8
MVGAKLKKRTLVEEGNSIAASEVEHTFSHDTDSTAEVLKSKLRKADGRKKKIKLMNKNGVQINIDKVEELGHEDGVSDVLESENKQIEASPRKKKHKLMSKKKREKEKGGDSGIGRLDQIMSENEETRSNLISENKQIEAGPRKKNHKLMSKKKREKEKGGDSGIGIFDQIMSENEETRSNLISENKQIEAGPRKKNHKLMSKKKREKEKGGDSGIGRLDQIMSGNEETRSNLISDGRMGEIIKHNKCVQVATRSSMVNAVEPVERAEKKIHVKPKKARKPTDNKNEFEEDEVYQISSGDEDCSKGMKKWLTEYHQNRPGLNTLQHRIDEFIMAHEAQEEKAKKEREAQAADGGWTVVLHQKGRKKTTDSESGITVGSVSQLAAVDKMEKKKNKVAVDFYNFQRREAQRHEVMKLQNKFELDKKRIQQLRAARKFKPY